MAGDFLQYCRPAWRQQGVTLPPFAAFWQANRLLEMPEDPANAQFVRFADFRRDPDNHPLKTASGKIEIYSARIASYGYADCPGHSMWLVPDEWHGNADAGQVQLLSAHPAHRLHSQLNYSSLRERYAVAGREPVTIHPQDATRAESSMAIRYASGIIAGRFWRARSLPTEFGLALSVFTKAHGRTLNLPQAAYAKTAR